MTAIKPGWNIENHEPTIGGGVPPRWPKSREEITFLEDANRNEVRVGDRVRLTGGPRGGTPRPNTSFGWHFTEGWVIGLSPSFEHPEKWTSEGWYIDKLDRRYSSFRVRSDDGVETGWNVGNTVKVEMNEEELAWVLDRAYRLAIRRTEDIIEEYEAWLRKLKSRRKEVSEGVTA